jgi:hypothetical protein
VPARPRYLTAPLVEKGVVGLVAVKLWRIAGAAHGGVQRIDGGRRAPVVLVGEMPLEGNPDVGRVGKLLRWNAIEADPGGKIRHVHCGGNGQRAAHAKTHRRNLGASQCTQMIDRAANVLVGGSRKIQTVHQVIRLVGLLGHAALEQVRCQRVVAGPREAVGDAANLVIQAPPFLDHHHAGLALPGAGKVAATGTAVGPLEVDHLSHAGLLRDLESGIYRKSRSIALV